MMVAQQAPNHSSFSSDLRSHEDDPISSYARALHDYTRKLWLEALRQEQMAKDKSGGGGDDRHRKSQWRMRKDKA
ncbi:hypothetical protein CALCODRAFT_486673 [Calocera cornea HHB12733]|uniref:Uncharacterized protein n=1 Tax=Calocera cornea HHB12733 TaxID=1353952 RepID=A0A165DKX8_9BASI|nr:hypothetical protein CALCODRAFT_486673 [Calocera cornea HHB12733]